MRITNGEASALVELLELGRQRMRQVRAYIRPPEATPASVPGPCVLLMAKPSGRVVRDQVCNRRFLSWSRDWRKIGFLSGRVRGFFKVGKG